MYNVLKEMEALKEYNQLLEKEIHKLGRLQRTESGIKKQGMIPVHRQRQKEIREKFKELVPLVQEWVEQFQGDDIDYANAIVAHYCDFNKLPDMMSVSIDINIRDRYYKNGRKKEDGISKSNFTDKIKKLVVKYPR